VYIPFSSELKLDATSKDISCNSNIYTLIPSCRLIVLQLLDLKSFLKRLVFTFFKYKNSDDREMTKCNSSHFQISYKAITTRQSEDITLLRIYKLYSWGV
jgi:hypothetical protein